MSKGSGSTREGSSGNPRGMSSTSSSASSLSLSRSIMNAMSSSDKTRLNEAINSVPGDGYGGYRYTDIAAVDINVGGNHYEVTAKSTPTFNGSEPNGADVTISVKDYSNDNMTRGYYKYHIDGNTSRSKIGESQIAKAIESIKRKR